MPPQSVRAVDALAGDADFDAPRAQGGAAAWNVIGLIGVSLRWAGAPLPGGPRDRRHGIEDRLENGAVVAVGARQAPTQGDAASVDHKMALRARFTAICWIRAGRDAPFLAGMLALSMLARSQSIWSARPRRSSSTSTKRSQTPAACQSRSRRQQVMPDPQPSSAGSISQGMPDWSTKMMPAKHVRSGTRGRPPGAWAVPPATAVRRWSITHPRPRTCSCLTWPQTRFHGFVRGSKSYVLRLQSFGNGRKRA